MIYVRDSVRSWEGGATGAAAVTRDRDEKNGRGETGRDEGRNEAVGFALFVCFGLIHAKDVAAFPLVSF